MNDLILLSREERKEYINALVKKYNLVIVIKANIPGLNKNLSEAFILTNAFKHEVIKLFDVLYCEFYHSNDGPYYLIGLNDLSGMDVKLKLIKLENDHPLGRFIDLDLYDDEGTSFSRNSLRLCYLCDNPAIICARNKTHTIAELINKVQSSVYSYLINEVTMIIEQSILAELNLHPKFGLVTPFSNGSHIDMNYELMLKAKDAIVPYLVKMFIVGYENDDLMIIFKISKNIGIEAEKAMLKATNNINAYKGLIFILGLLVCSASYAIKHHQSYDDIYENVKIMCNDIFNNINNEEKTFGVNAYLHNNFGGARKEAFYGLPTLNKAVNYLKQFKTLNNESLTMTLIYIIRLLEDSVLLKRSGSLTVYNQIKQRFLDIKHYDIDQINELTTYCIKHNLSFGGSADLLIGAVFIHLISDKFI
jgi:holo-ACP synthase CitX